MAGRRVKRITVHKESGLTEAFDEDKLLESLIGSGTTPKTAEEVFRKITPELKPDITAGELYSLATRQLGSCDRLSKMRYSLKRAIFALGPSGYPFEKYVARILTAEGYDTKVGVHVGGRCVRHEVDVVARRDRTVFFVECKFHTSAGIYSDIKTALYVQARFEDIRKAMDKKRSAQGGRQIHYHGMLVTNTRLSAQALKFANCTGLSAIGWKHPKKKGLEKLIDRHKVYPVTVIPSVKGRTLEALARNDLITVNLIKGMSVDVLAEKTGIDEKTAVRIIRQSAALCGLAG